MENLCENCGYPRPPKNKKYCTRIECKRERNAASQRRYQDKYRSEHGRSSTRKYENLPEYKAKKAIRDKKVYERLGSSRERYPAYHAARDYRRRMLLKERTVEEFAPVEVFERDKWVCQICGEPVDPAVKYPDPLSKSLDHKTPLKLGGEHSRTNTQLAHLSCNILKRDNEEPDIIKILLKNLI